MMNFAGRRPGTEGHVGISKNVFRHSITIDERLIFYRYQFFVNRPGFAYLLDENFQNLKTAYK